MRSCRAPALLVLAFACAAAAAEPPVWHLRLTNETAVETKDAEVTKFRNRLEPELTWDIRPDLRFNANVRLLWDPAFEGWGNEAALRDLTLDWKGEGMALKGGLQQVVWGQASGFLSGFDVFHPRDLREFVLPPFDFLRRPLWLLRTQHNLGAWSLEAVWSSQEIFDRVPGPGETFYVPAPQPAGYFFIDAGRDSDRQRLGLRAARSFAAWDLSLIYMRVPRSDTVFLRELAGSGVVRTTELLRTFDVVGFTFAHATGRTVWRGELSAYLGRDYQTTAAIGGVRQADQINAVIGLDMSFLRDLDLTVEVGRRHIRGHLPDFVEPEERSTALVQLRKPFRHDTLVPSLAVIVNTRDGDSLWRPAIQWSATDRLGVSAGLDLFNGTSASPFGRFREKDRIFLGLTYQR